MKGKINFYFNAPNISKVRSRVEKPSENFTQNVRQAINDTLIEVINEQTVAIRAKLAVKFQAMGEAVKSPAIADALGNVLNSFWDVQVASTPFRDEELAEKPDDTAAESAEVKGEVIVGTPADEFED